MHFKNILFLILILFIGIYVCMFINGIITSFCDKQVSDTLLLLQIGHNKSNDCDKIQTEEISKSKIECPKLISKEKIVYKIIKDPQNSSLISIDKYVRNCITGNIIGKLPNIYKKKYRINKLKNSKSEKQKNLKESFQKIFEFRAWGQNWDQNYTGLSSSGMGSTLQWTQEITAILHILVNRIKSDYNLQRVRILDVPCGDMAWMSRFLMTRDDVDYTGVDVVSQLISNHKKQFSKYDWRFVEADIVHDYSVLEKSKFDLILSRTLFQHLYNYDVQKLLKVFSSSSAKFLLATTFAREENNEELDISNDNPGRFRRVNLEIPPFNLVPPTCLSRDGPPDYREGWDHFIGVWRLPLEMVVNCETVKRFKLYATDKYLRSCTKWGLD